ncbi:MAG: gamma-glutamyltransferase [Gemmatimonadota bacterium]|nr:gamma-glutamyltransferase [Gemmatimonadota bacterium]
MTTDQVWPHDLDAPPVTGRNGMVVSADAYATQVGVGILERGGNAVDAAIATSFALAVTYPTAGNIGGGGFMVLRLNDGSVGALDYRETAPSGATRDMYLDEDGNVTNRSLFGALAAGVPGSVMGLWEAHRRFGSLPWADLLQPAISLAEGFAVQESLHRGLTRVQARLDELDDELQTHFEATRNAFFPNGTVPELGETLSLPDLAKTLERIRDNGPDGFYRGETADLIVREMEKDGGLISHRDLADYTAEWREPIQFNYRDHTVISMPPVSSGGATMAEMANILMGYDLGSLQFDSAERIHLMAEAMKRAYSDRNQYLGDPAFVEMPLDRMISPEYAEERRADILPDRATASEDVGPMLGSVDRGTNTTHLSVVDADGNAVSVTTTINTGYGSLVVVGGAGFLLNNEMDDFAAKPGTPNAYGLVQGEANAIEGGKRMLSSMTPSIVLDSEGDLKLVTGTPGGSTIITVVFQTISNAVDFGMNVSAVVNAPRLHHQHLPDVIRLEEAGFSAATISELEGMGHTVQTVGGLGDIQAIMIMEDGTMAGASDPRGYGVAQAASSQGAATDKQ